MFARAFGISCCFCYYYCCCCYCCLLLLRLPLLLLLLLLLLLHYCWVVLLGDIFSFFQLSCESYVYSDGCCTEPSESSGYEY